MERQEVLQQKLEHWSAASIRALSDRTSVQYRGHFLYVDNLPFTVKAPYLHLDLNPQDASKQRGVADAIALRLSHSNAQLHQQLMPEPALQQLIFELLEQLRCESLAPASLPGMRVNLRRRFTWWAELTATSRLTENNIGLLIYSLLVICWSRLSNEVIPEQVDAEIEATRMALAKLIGNQLYAFKPLRSDQHAFSEQALEIAEIIDDMVGEIEADEQSNEGDANETVLSQLLNSSGLNLQWLSADSATWSNSTGISETAEPNQLSDTFEYRVFTQEWDIEVSAAKTMRSAQLKKLREQLDKRIRKQSINVHRVARYMQLLFRQPERSGWDFSKEEGYLDSSRLARLVSAPHDRRLFRREAQDPSSNAVVSILIDNSGSMNHHSETIAALADTLTRSLELAGIKSEVLGFTTQDWNGGRIQKQWIAAGKPENPGRLNALRHTIYKDADTRWRRARPSIAALLRTDLFREGIDGEALLWASDRLNQRLEKRKVIMVISDGSPMDTATHNVNEERYLDQHLIQVVRKIEQQTDIRICGLGVGLDLSSFYSVSKAITIENIFSTAELSEIADLLAA